MRAIPEASDTLLRLVKTKVILLACGLIGVARPDATRANRPRADPALLVDEPASLARLEANGYAFREVVGPAKWRAVVATLARDMAEITDGLAPDSVRRPFQIGWLERGRFELIGVVNRFDRRFDPPGQPSCGEVRLVYRLALHNRGRPPTRLPMTVNVRIPQRPGAAGCRRVAELWRSEKDVLAILRTLPSFTHLETNFQSVHIPSYRHDMDDTAEYVLRSFKVVRDSLAVDTLLNTPRADLSDGEVAELKTWIEDNVPAIDHGVAQVPDKFLATRAVSVSPRGLLRRANRPFSSYFGDRESGLRGAPLGATVLATTPELLLRRLDESTCVGCHQSRGVAGFHLLGEEADASRTFNALAVGHSPHMAAELPWRAEVLAGAAQGREPPRPRPFSGHPDGQGVEGAQCGIDPGFASWTCAPGLQCRDMQGASVGVCARSQSARPGDPCERVTTEPSERPEGAIVTSAAVDPSCPSVNHPGATRAFCAPNWLGFTGGMCSALCARIGEIQGGAICAPLPAEGYEADCFRSREPIERCLTRHFVSAEVASCDAERPCRDDYACTRVPGAPEGEGACVPPYFVFQARVDGPELDR